MPYRLPPDVDHRVRAYLAAGGFQNEGDVLRTALDALEERDQEKLRRWHEGNDLAMEQSRQGLSKPLDVEAVLVRVRTRLAKEGIPDCLRRPGTSPKAGGGFRRSALTFR
jgi:Arc/MetJ-type ribon-helix-helix transcriptional regulator